MEKFEKKPLSKKKKIVLIVVGVLLALVIVALIIGVSFYTRMLNSIKRFEDVPATVATEPVTDTEPVEDATTAPTLDPYDFEVMFPGEEPLGGEIINIMLVGQDTRDAEYRGLADTMILISINPKTGKLVMTSFIRDLYIDIVGIGGTGTYKDRLNTAYCTGGIDQLGDTLAYNFGVEIDNYVEVDFEAFRKIVDVLGGVDIELTENEANYLNGEITFSNGEWDLKEGMNHLTGAQALGYARIRAIDNDFNRTARQRYVINELLKLVKDASIKDLLGLAEEFFPMVTTDMSNMEITKYIIQLAPLLKDLEIESLRVPADTTWTGKNVGTEEEPKYVIECFDIKANRDMIREAIGATEEATE